MNNPERLIMSPKRAKTLRLYAQLHEALDNPLRVSYRRLKRSLTHNIMSGKAKGKLYKRVALLTRLPVYVRPSDGVGELRMAGLPIEQDMLARARRMHPRPDDAVWELSVRPDALRLHQVGLPHDIRYVVPLG